MRPPAREVLVTTPHHVTAQVGIIDAYQQLGSYLKGRNTPGAGCVPLSLQRTGPPYLSGGIHSRTFGFGDSENPS